VLCVPCSVSGLFLPLKNASFSFWFTNDHSVVCVVM
jgi:hypothetical protein